MSEGPCPPQAAALVCVPAPPPILYLYNIMGGDYSKYISYSELYYLIPSFNNKTEYDKETHIDNRKNYIEGAGQMCQPCHQRIY